MKEINNIITCNLNKLNQTLGVLCIKKDSEVVLNLNNGNVKFIHPAIHAFFNYPDDMIPIEFLQLFANWNLSEVITVKSDNFGLVYLPQIGVIKTSFPNEVFDLKICDKKISLSKSGVNLDFELYKNETINMSRLEVLRLFPELFHFTFCETYRGIIVNESPGFKLELPLNAIESAVTLLQNYFHDFYTKMMETSSLLFVHNNPKVLNYISYMTHGLIVLYFIDKEHDEIYFYEELIHQGSHNLLKILTFNKETFFKVDVENLLI